MKDTYNEKIKWFKEKGYEEQTPMDYYRTIFPEGSFQKVGESKGDYKPNGLLQFRNPTDLKATMHGSIINDDLQVIQDCIERKGRYANHDFVLISGCSYIGRRKTTENARYCHAIIIDLDAVSAKELDGFFMLVDGGEIPMPTSIVVSGNGVHVAYVLSKPIPMYKQKAEMLSLLKFCLTRKIWNKYTSQDGKLQYQGLVQGYRVPGTKTKKGHIAKAYKCREPYRIEDLIKYVDNFYSMPFGKETKKSKKSAYSEIPMSKRLQEAAKNSRLMQDMVDVLCVDELKYTKSEAKEELPEWYQRRVVEKQPAGHLPIPRTVYDKWLKEIKEKATVGHRGKCLYCLSACAQKCNIPEAEFIKDAYALVPLFDKLTEKEDNHFTDADVERTISNYRERDLTKMSFAAMERMTGIKYPKNERKKGGKRGRPKISGIISEYLAAHPDEKNVSLIAKECGCTRPTVYKYLKSR